jgi:SAM-dependent methyltransferase
VYIWRAYAGFEPAIRRFGHAHESARVAYNYKYFSMKVRRLLYNANPTYSLFYHPSYRYSMEENASNLRYEDQWAAVCYAHGIYLNDLPKIDSVTEQINYIKQTATRKPRSVLEIGSGRGEVSAALDSLGIVVQSIDVNASVEQYHRTTSQIMFGKESTYDLFIGDLDTTFDFLDLSVIDTVILVETIEHIFPDEWDRFYKKIKPILIANNCQLIATNEKWYWPLGHAGDCNEHVNKIDDDFYDVLCSDAKKVCYRSTSHLCIEY